MAILDLFNLAGKVALVTGGARGIGQAIALGLAEAGADVFLIDRLPCTETVQKIVQIGANGHAEVKDLAGLDGTKADAIINAVVERFGKLDILVNNAGIIRRSHSIEVSQADWHQVLDINLHAAFFLSQATGKYFLGVERPGKIINLASMLSFQGGLMVPSYTASKSAILGVTKALANEWAAKGINVNAIAPGYLITDVTAGIRVDAERNRRVLERIPAGQWGNPEDVKGAVVFLASGAADYVHGSVIPIDGGWLGR